jgi:hypothetical protein
MRGRDSSCNCILLLGVSKWGGAPRPELMPWACPDRGYTISMKEPSRISWHDLQELDANADLKHNH